MSKLKQTFRLYNRRYFGNLLPPDTIVIWSSKLGSEDGRKIMGDCDNECIRIRDELKTFGLSWKLTLLHEMAHLATADERAAHGPRFKREMRRLYRAGAFDDLL